jgi:hypothetical protein
LLKEALDLRAASLQAAMQTVRQQEEEQRVDPDAMVSALQVQLARGIGALQRMQADLQRWGAAVASEQTGTLAEVEERPLSPRAKARTDRRQFVREQSLRTAGSARRPVPAAEAGGGEAGVPTKTPRPPTDPRGARPTLRWLGIEKGRE